MKKDEKLKSNHIIKVIGVGGGGSNAVSHMFRSGIKGVEFIVCNTDQQALESSPVPVKIQLGQSLTEGRGAGSIPDIGKNSAIESLDEIQSVLNNKTKMLFITAGMGGGTGTGAAPIIAEVAKEMNILTVGIVTIPFAFEGKKRMLQAKEGIDQLRKNVDTLIIITNDRLREMYGNLTLGNAFEQADFVLTSAAKGIAEIISITGLINVDFNDVNTVMKNSGVAIMGTATAEGENRAIKAVEQALCSPLLNDNNIYGAKHILLNITYGDREVLMDEITEITDFVQDAAGKNADIVWGHGKDESLGEKVSVTIIATGFNTAPDSGLPQDAPSKTYRALDENVPTMITSPLLSPVSTQENILEKTLLIEENDKIDEPYLKEEKQSKNESETQLNLKEKKPSELPTEPPPIPSIKEEIPTMKNNIIEFDLTLEDTTDLDDEELNSAIDETFQFKKYNLEDDESNGYNENSSIEKEIMDTSPLPSKKVVKTIDKEEQQRVANERLQRIKEVSQKLRTPSGLAELENEPAYVRRNINLDRFHHSKDSQVSKYTLSQKEMPDGTIKTELKENNSFLHDNVD